MNESEVNTNMTIAEKWTEALWNTKGNTRKAIRVAMYREHLNRYTLHNGWEFFLFADNSVYSEDSGCWTKTELVGRSASSYATMLDGLTRTFWPHALPEIGDMSLFFDTESFSGYAGNRRYCFTFGTWQQGGKGDRIEYTADVHALLDVQGKNGGPAAYKFKLCMSYGGRDHDYDANYDAMPAPETNASWNDPMHWQEVVERMESLCAEQEASFAGRRSKARS